MAEIESRDASKRRHIEIRNAVRSEKAGIVPYDAVAEACVLSTAMHSREAADEIFAAVAPIDFHMPSHRVLFETMRFMHESGMPIDEVSLMDMLRSRHALEKAGGKKEVTALGSRVLPLVSWQHHLEAVVHASTLREIIYAAREINVLAHEAPTTTSEIVEQSESILLGALERKRVDTYSTLTGYLVEAYTEAVEACGGAAKDPIIDTGYRTLDGMLSGLRPGQLVILGARPAVGKTSFAMNIASYAASKGASICFFSLEMSGKELAQRFICSHAGIELSRMRTGDLDKSAWSRITAATDELGELDIQIDDTPGVTVTEIKACARRMLRGRDKGLIIVDYLQLITPPRGARPSDNRAVEVAEMSRALKIMAKDLGVPIIALSQLSRAVELRADKRPQLSDLRESGSIEQDADVVMFLDRSVSKEEAVREGRPALGTARVIVAKNRSGPIGDLDLVFRAATTCFVELSNDSSPVRH